MGKNKPRHANHVGVLLLYVPSGVISPFEIEHAIKKYFAKSMDACTVPEIPKSVNNASQFHATTLF